MGRIRQAVVFTVYLTKPLRCGRKGVRYGKTFTEFGEAKLYADRALRGHGALGYRIDRSEIVARKVVEP